MNAEALRKMLLEADQARLWGSIELHFQDGRLVLIRRTQTTKLNTDKENNRREPTNSQ